jgi:hypothetical protein
MGLNTMVTGLPICTTCPVGVSLPVAGSIRKVMTVSLYFLRPVSQ